MLKKVRTFIGEVMVEMKKVSWPIKRGKNVKPSERYRELRDSTLMVIVSTLLLSAYIGLVDVVLSRLMGLLMS